MVLLTILFKRTSCFKFCLLLIYPWGGDPLVFEVGYHPCKKNHVIRVVFQDQAMYAGTSFRDAKTCKIGKKRVCFWSYWQILERTWWTNYEKRMQNAYLGSIFTPEKYVFRVCFESPFTRMISSLTSAPQTYLVRQQSESLRLIRLIGSAMFGATFNLVLNSLWRLPSFSVPKNTVFQYA